MRTLRISRCVDEALGIRSYELVDPDGALLPPFEPGAHINLHLPDGRTRSYSLCNDPQERQRYVIAVLREPAGRGGSVYVHDNLAVGSQVQISDPLNNFQLMAGASIYTLIAGGIGITPILSMARYLERTGAAYSIHYCARNPERAAFREILHTAPFSRRTVMHFDGEHSGQRLDLASLLRERVEGQQVYCCGPAGLIDGVKAATWDWQANSVHFERFKIDPALLTGSGQDSTFEIEIDSTGQILEVPPQKSILHVLRENGIFPDSSCEEGICGTCATGLLGGTADHRDFVLTDEEKASQTVVMICCSRAGSRRLKLDL